MATYNRKKKTYVTNDKVIINPRKFIYKGINFAPVFNPQFYASKYPEIAELYKNDDLLFNHFINKGIAEGHVGTAAFDINTYKEVYKYKNKKELDNDIDYYIAYLTSN